MKELDHSFMLPVGTILDSRYRLQRHLSSGGFGNTYAAFDMRFDGYVAIKEFFMRGINHRAPDHYTVLVSNVVNKEIFNAQLAKFKREAKRIFNIHNEHIIRVIDCFDGFGTSFYVMELIEGESLKDRVERRLLTEQEVRRIANQLFDALEAIHKAGFFHLDVKPGNIMIDKNDHCTLIDFGASKQIGMKEQNSLSISNMAFTPGYAPIEQVSQLIQNIGPWTDFFAVGATLYKLLTGKNPPEINPYDTDDNSRMFSYPAEVSGLMRQAISQMMNPDYRKRPQNVEELKLLIKGKRLKKKDVTKTIPSSKSNHAKREIAVTETQGHNQSVNNHDILKKHKYKRNSNRNKKAAIILSILSLGLVAYIGFLIIDGGISANHVSSHISQDKTNNENAETEELKQVNDGILYDYDKDKEQTRDSNFELMNTAFSNTLWHYTEYGFKVPDIMSHTPDVLIEEYGLSVDRWDYEDVCMSYCPLMGNWAVEEYPDIGSFITDDIVIKSITYKDDNRSIYSGYTDDGRIWYMKKHVTSGGVVLHASFLSIIYPKLMQPNIDKLIGEVQGY